ncbi:hypothetical protein ACHAW5_006563 [Stephanodiscus triporus]|uniref:Meiotic nuclear division protein 1 homolog n=1 Tax=Stephanodiscus triporus TaxID=2934178 RepID=A0ABD3PUS2_9STRA
MSNKTVRMSADEKRRAILGIYHRTKEVYTEKEIIALAAKAGVNQNTIADINQSLCDDGLVDKDKIGGSNYYWSFPAKKDRLLQLEHEGTLLKIEALRASVKDAEARLADAKRGREEEGEEGESSSSRASKMARRSELLAEINAARIELEKLRQNDPKEIANLEKEFDLVRGAAHRWTDNIFSCKDYLVKKRGMMKAEDPEDKMSKKK